MTEILLAIIVLGLLLWWLNRKRFSLGSSRKASRRFSSAGSSAVPEHMMRQLDRLTKDRRVSERLLHRIEFNHPGRSKRWYVEKAIYDIQRDRRS